MSNDLDEFDKKILRVLQKEADISMQDLGDRIGLSHTPCWRRVKRLQEQGIIRGKVTLLDENQVSLPVTVYTYLTIKSHDEDVLNEFESSVLEVPEVMECYSTTGEKDYVLRVVAASVSHYEQILKRKLVHLPHVDSVSSTFALKQVKYTTELPV
ncbi:MAG: Lrp/AsnC family transcriptional regulator [Cellvibrionaceae bacterium]